MEIVLRGHKIKNLSELTATFYDGCQGQIVKGFVEIIPNVLITVLLVHLIIEAIHVCDVSGLVVAPQEDQPVWILELVQEQQSDGLH